MNQLQLVTSLAACLDLMATSASFRPHLPSSRAASATLFLYGGSTGFRDAVPLRLQWADGKDMVGIAIGTASKAVVPVLTADVCWHSDS